MMNNIGKGSRSLQNLIAISLGYRQLPDALKAGCEWNNGENGYSIQGLVAKVKDTVAEFG